MDEMKKPNPKKTAPKAFYLGTDAETERRYAEIERIARQFGVKRSKLLQMIADGELVVGRPDKQAV